MSAHNPKANTLVVSGRSVTRFCRAVSEIHKIDTEIGDCSAAGTDGGKAVPMSQFTSKSHCKTLFLKEKSGQSKPK